MLKPKKKVKKKETSHRLSETVAHKYETTVAISARLPSPIFYGLDREHYFRHVNINKYCLNVYKE